MPNYNLVVDSTFQPFSLERYLQPLAIYGRAYNDAADTLDALSVDAGPLQNQINKDTDPDLYNQYNTYMGDLNALVDGMAKNDRPLSSILSDARKLRRGYYKSIVPIKEGLKKLEEFNKEKRNLQSRDNSLRFSDVTLTDIVNNPNSSYSMLSGNEIMDSTVKAVSNLAKRIQGDPEYSKILGDQYWQSRIQQGYTPEQIVLASINDPQAPKELRNLKNSIHASYTNNAAYDRDWVDQYINRGLYSAIGSTQYGTMANRNFISAAERDRLQLDRDRFEAEHMKDAQGNWVRRPTLLPMEDGNMTDGRLVYNKDGQIISTLSQYTKGNPAPGSDPTLDPKTGKLIVSNFDWNKVEEADFVNGNQMYPNEEYKKDWIHDNYFSDNHHLYDWSKLSSKAKLNIQKWIAKQVGVPEVFANKIPVEDLYDLYEDYDGLSYSRYRVKRKKPEDKSGEDTEQLNFQGGN